MVSIRGINRIHNMLDSLWKFVESTVCQDLIQIMEIEHPIRVKPLSSWNLDSVAGGVGETDNIKNEPLNI